MVQDTTESQRLQKQINKGDTKTTETKEKTKKRGNRDTKGNCFMNDNHSCFYIIQEAELLLQLYPCFI